MGGVWLVVTEDEKRADVRGRTHHQLSSDFLLSRLRLRVCGTFFSFPSHVRNHPITVALPSSSLVIHGEIRVTF